MWKIVKNVLKPRVIHTCQHQCYLTQFHQNRAELFHIDTLELPMSENESKYLFVAIDYSSRFCILHPMSNKKVETIASVNFSEIITAFSTPRIIITDNGSELNNKNLEELCNFFHVKKINVQAYHPQSNSVVERFNRNIINCLSSLINPYSV